MGLLTTMQGAGVGTVATVSGVAPDGSGNVPLTSDNVTEGATNKYLLADSVGLAELEPSTRGDIITKDADGNPIYLANPGAKIQVLTSNGSGDNQWRAHLGEMIGSQQVVNGSSVTFSNVNPNFFYNALILDFSRVAFTSITHSFIRLVNSSNVVDAGNFYNYAVTLRTPTAGVGVPTTVVQGSDSNTSVMRLENAASIAANNNICGRVTVQDIRGVLTSKQVNWDSSYLPNGGSIKVQASGGGDYLNNLGDKQVKGIHFQPAIGLMTGEFRLWAVPDII